jgi:LysR family glycine cleavage system transcriptional activator
MKPPGKLPPLPALRAFEATARLGGVSAAANELHVTHSAVSQQIRSLEVALGVKLFGRSGRGVILTAAGQELALGANDALCAIARTSSLVRRRANPKRMTITTLPSFAACWLTPRIARFIEEMPGVEINLISTSNVLDFARDGIDVAIRFGHGNYEGQDATLLMHDEMLVVASPGYVAKMNIREPTDLSRCVLLRSDDESWALWFAHAGLDWPEPDKGLFFDDFALALTWAENGHGVALTRRCLADEALRKGTLLHILDITLPSERAYWFVVPQGLEPTPVLDRFRKWLFNEARSMMPAA